MKKADLLENKLKTKGILVFLIIISVIALLCSLLIMRGSDIANNEVNRYLSEISQQTSYKVNQGIDMNIDKLTTIGRSLRYLNKEKQESYIKEILADSAYEWIGIVSSEGVIRTTNDQGVHLNNLQIIQEALQGQSVVSEEIVENSQGEKGTLYAVPYQENNEKNVLVGWMPSDTMRLLLNTDTFDGTGFSHIVSKNGNFILYSENSNSALKGDNFFTSLEEQGKVSDGYHLESMKKNLLDGIDGEIEFTIGNNEERALIYTALDEGNWYLLSIVPPDIYNTLISSYIFQSVLTVAGSVSVLFICLFIMIWWVTKNKNREIYNIAFVDPITLGFTQPRLKIEIDELMSHFEPFSFITLDLKKFKLINDSFGSYEGNRVLNHVYHCIKKNLNDKESVSRINADNFDIIFKTIDKEEISERLAKIATDINEFNKEREIPYFIPIICGTYIVTQKDDTMITIHDRANAARKKNKQKGQLLCNNLFYEELERLNMIKEKEIENSMEKALENHEFEVYLQPKVCLKTGKVIGAEALVRWIHPTKGMIYPNDFIPLFEENGFILKLDQYVFEEVCKLLRRWIDEEKPLRRISVNLSRNHLNKQGFLKEYSVIQKKYNVPPELLEIELTETIVFENLSLLKDIIDDIHNMGFLCSMDDFGSGYSSLNVLKEVPVDILKLDRIFFDNEATKRSNDVVQSVIELAKKLDMETVAEGIETIPQVESLQKMQCDIIQGYVFAKPMPISEFEEKYNKDLAIIDVSH